VPIFRSVENHPLLIQALASEIANYKKAPGNCEKWLKDHLQFDPTSLPLVQSRTHILGYSLQGLTKSVREVLHMLVGFRMPASYATLDALLVGKEKACGSARELDRALTELEDRGLVGWDREANRYDAHPIVRGVVWQLTDARDQHTVLTALEAHFEPMTTPEWTKVETLADLTSAIERYHTLVGLRRYEDAVRLFYDTLSDATMYRLAAHRERIAWLEAFFTNAEEGLLSLTNERSRAFLLNTLAQSYYFSGQPARATPLFRRAAEIDQLGNEDSLQITQSNWADPLYQIGSLRETETLSRCALISSRKLEDRFWEAVGLRNFGRLRCAIGDRFVGMSAVRRALHIARNYPQSEGVGLAQLAEVLMWIGDANLARSSADRAWELAANLGIERDFIEALLLRGRAALVLGDLLKADEFLGHALVRARTVNVVELELPALTALAELELKCGHPAEAKARLEGVWDAAERGPYPLQQADAYNLLAAIEVAENNKLAAIDAATKAYTAAWCDGPPYAYYWGLGKAKAHLAALGAPEPDMPPFDESKFEPMPEVEINPKDEYWVDPDKLD
jgi:tetratricopeptide (TPR) repeat protein